MPDMDIGDRIRQIRHRRGMTQDELAERSGVHLDTIKKLETKIREGARISTLHALARGLDVQTSDLLGTGIELDPDDNGDAASLLAMRHVLIPSYPPAIGAPMSSADLSLAVRDSVRLFSQSRVRPLLETLPGYLAGGDALLAASSATDGLKPLATLYITAAQALNHARREDLASEAIRRAIALSERASDQVLYSLAIDTLAWILLRQARFEEAERMSLSMARDIEPRFGDADTDHLAAWGRALVRASAGAARNNKPAAAGEYLAQARLASDRMGSDLRRYGVYWMSFGPHGLATAELENAVVMGDYEQAVALASGDIPTIESNHHLRHLLNISEAQIGTKRYGDAISTINGINTASSEWLVRQRAARRQVRDLLDIVSTRRARTSGLTALASEMHIRP
jgi:transcriptional regulator with XRE-family HTH domain